MVDPNKLRDLRNIAAINRICDNILTRIKIKETCSIISVSGIGKSPIFDAISDSLGTEQNGYTVRTLNAKKVEELDAFIDDLTENFTPTICIIKITFEEECEAQIQKINQLRIEHYTDFISVLLGSLGNVYSSFATKPQILVKSMFIIPPYSQEDCYEILKQYEIKYNLVISEEAKHKIAKLSGGHTGLLKSLFMIELDNPGIDFVPTELIKNESIVMWMHYIVNSLPEGIISQIDSQSRTFEAQDVFDKFGIMKKGKCFSPLFDEYLKYRKKKVLDNNLEHQLSSQERKVFELFQIKKNTIISRDEIAQTIWDEAIDDKYSDWSIDQVIYRIRQKLKTSASSGKIVTKKKLGFIYLEQ